MLWEQKVEFAAKSDIGFRRQNNQDSYSIHLAQDPESYNRQGHLFLVADGMGGHAVGELASKMAADLIPHAYHKLNNLPIEQALEQAIVESNTAINQRGHQNHDFLRMGTTLTALVLSPNGAFAGHVGDSRLYRIRRGRIEQLTFDHSLQWELLRQGRMSPEDIFLHEPRNVITRCLGPEPQVQADVEGPHEVYSGDIYLLCSDGLTGLLDDNEIGTIAREMPPAEACRLLIHLANLRGGPDNITVVIVRVNAPTDEFTSDSTPEPTESEDGGISWKWLIGWSLLTLSLVVGIPVLLMGLQVQHQELRIPGILMLGFAGLQAVIMGWAWWRSRRRRRLEFQVGKISNAGGPYRIAEANVTKKLIGQLSAIEHDLHQTALEENWSVDWKAYEVDFKEAKSSLERHHFSRSLRILGKVIDHLMSGMQSYRKSKEHAAKWGIPPRGNTTPADSNGG